MRLLSILTSPRPDSVSTTIDAESIGAKYKGVSGASLSATEQKTWGDIQHLASRFKNADRIVLGVPMWNFSYPYKFKQLVDLSCQRNMLFTFDGKNYGPSLTIDKAFVVLVRGQSDEAGISHLNSPGFAHVSDYIDFWLKFIGVREVMTLAVEHTWDGRAHDTIEAAKIRAAELAHTF